MQTFGLEEEFQSNLEPEDLTPKVCNTTVTII